MDHRGSFLQYLQLPTPPSACETETAWDRGPAWDRLIHSATLLGHALLVSLVGVLYLIYASALKWTRPDDDGVQVLDNFAVLLGLYMPAMFGYAFATWANVAQSTAYPDCGTKNAHWSAFVGVVLVPVFGGLLAALILVGDVDLKYYGLDLFAGMLYVVVFMVADIKGRRTPAATHNAGTNSESSVVQNTSETTTPTRKGSILFGLIPVLSAFSLGFLYPFLVIPLFVGGTVTTRLLITLLLHPFLLEAAEAIGRSSTAESIAEELKSGKSTQQQAEARIVQASLGACNVKQLMAFYRRLMLLNASENQARRDGKSVSVSSRDSKPER